MIDKTSAQFKAYTALSIMPLFFCSNMIIGRWIIPHTEPFLLAFLRWFITACLIFLVAYPSIKSSKKEIVKNWKLIFILSFFGMWICGALVYWALKYTSASNGTLIYTSSAALIICFEYLFRNRKIGIREWIGVPLAIIGVMVIIFQGDFNQLLSIQLNSGDLLFLIAAIAWALYSVFLKNNALNEIPVLALFSMLAFAGSILLAPFAIYEVMTSEVARNFSTKHLGALFGLVFLSSIIPFTALQYGIRTVGSSVAGVFMYLLPPYGVLLAVILLSEQLFPFHYVGFAVIISGVILATFPKKFL